MYSSVGYFNGISFNNNYLIKNKTQRTLIPEEYIFLKRKKKEEKLYVKI